MNNTPEDLSTPFVWIVTESDEHGLRPSTFEILAEARDLADRLGGSMGAVILGENPSQHVESINNYKVDNIHLIEHPLLTHYNTDGYVKALAELIAEHKPYMTLISATPNGQDLAPRLAARLRFPIVTECVSVKMTRGGDLQFTKPTHDGKTYSTITCAASPPYMATIIPGVIGAEGVGETLPSKGKSAPEVTTLYPDIQPEMLHAKHIEIIPGDPKHIDLREAEKIVSGGRGVGDEEGWRLIEETADALAASVGGTRMAKDLGLCESHRMIGQTGKGVRPKFYLAAGVSGSDYHLRGVKTEALIAINKDKQAPIFGHSQLGIVGDLKDILPELIEKLDKKER